MAGLSGLKEIAAHMRKSETTVLKLHREYALPMRKVGGVWESHTESIDRWVRSLVESAPRDPGPGGNE